MNDLRNGGGVPILLLTSNNPILSRLCFEAACLMKSLLYPGEADYACLILDSSQQKLIC